MRFFPLILTCAGFFAAPTAASAQEFIERSFTGTSKQANLIEARREIQDQAAQQSVEELVKEIIGEDKFSRQKTLIQNRIVKNPGRFVPVVKPGEIKQSPEGFVMTVQVRLSPRNLRQALQQLGVLNENEGLPVVLPLITLTDRVNLKSERWWTPSDRDPRGALRGWSRSVEDSLNVVFLRSGFHLIRPVAGAMGQGLPPAYRVENFTQEEESFLGDWFGASLLLKGQVTVQRSGESSSVYRLEIRLSVLQISNGRPIADLSRIIETENGSFEQVVEKKLRESFESIAADLSAQVLDAWQKGAIGSRQMKLTLKGRWTLPQTESFKEKVRGGVPQIRQIHERLFSKDMVQFEIQSPSTPEELAKKITGLQWEGRRVSASVDDGQEVVLTMEEAR